MSKLTQLIIVPVISLFFTNGPIYAADPITAALAGGIEEVEAKAKGKVRGGFKYESEKIEMKDSLGNTTIKSKTECGSGCGTELDAQGKVKAKKGKEEYS